MRILSNRDMIAWTLLAAIVVAVAAYFAHQQATSSTSSDNVYRIIVTPDRPQTVRPVDSGRGDKAGRS